MSAEIPSLAEVVRDTMRVNSVVLIRLSLEAVS